MFCCSRLSQYRLLRSGYGDEDNKKHDCDEHWLELCTLSVNVTEWTITEREEVKVNVINRGRQMPRLPRYCCVFCYSTDLVT